MRTPITTTFTPRTKPTTVFEISRAWIDYLLQESLGKLLLESWDWALLLEESINTKWQDPRYNLYVEDLIWANVEDLTWDLVTWVSGTRTNEIDTNWL